MLDKRKFCYYFFMVLAIFSGIVSSQQLQVTPPVVTVVVGEENVNLLCRASKAVDYCAFIVPGEEQVGLSDQKPSTNSKLSYYGEGLQTGQCGVTIHRVTYERSGNATCTVFLDGGKSLTGSIEMIVATPPKVVEINVQSKSTNQGQQITAQCTAIGGEPPATLTWFLDNQQVYEGIGDIVIEYPSEQNKLADLEVNSEYRKILSADDNGKILECRAHSTGISDPMGYMLAKSQIIVEFAPVPQPDIQIFDQQLGQPAYLTINVKANPKPTFEWIVDGTGIREGEANGRFESMLAQKMEDGSFNVTLRINDLNQNDLSVKYALSATNSAGRQEYYVKVSSETQPAGLGVGEIIGIVLACLVIIAAVGLVVAARAMGKWCFAGSSSTSTTKMSETTDGGVGENLLLSSSPANSTSPVIVAPTRPATTLASASVYNETTVPITAQSFSQRSPQLSQTSSSIGYIDDNVSTVSSTPGLRGDYNELGLPRVRASKWLPAQQRELLERQANLLVNNKSKTTDIY